VKKKGTRNTSTPNIQAPPNTQKASREKKERKEKANFSKIVVCYSSLATRAVNLFYTKPGPKKKKENRKWHRKKTHAQSDTHKHTRALDLTFPNTKELQTAWEKISSRCV
jgi:hypothetical protein